MGSLCVPVDLITGVLLILPWILEESVFFFMLGSVGLRCAIVEVGNHFECVWKEIFPFVNDLRIL